MQYTNFHPIFSSYVKVGAYRAKAKSFIESIYQSILYNDEYVTVLCFHFFLPSNF